MKSDKVFLRHILDELDFLLKQTGGIDFDRFATDDVLRRACARSLEIIGEAVKNISPDLRKKYKDIEWTKIAGLRDKLIHGYFDVDLGILWDVIKTRLLPLKEQVEELLRQEGTGAAK
jgi:uncharacterized protein with HEPN domain